MSVGRLVIEMIKFGVSKRRLMTLLCDRIGVHCCCVAFFFYLETFGAVFEMRRRRHQCFWSTTVEPRTAPLKGLVRRFTLVCRGVHVGPLGAVLHPVLMYTHRSCAWKRSASHDALHEQPWCLCLLVVLTFTLGQRLWPVDRPHTSCRWGRGSAFK